jgi:hypothetical protein
MIDRRVRIMDEIVKNIWAVKLYAYEEHMGQKVTAVRQEEIKVLRAYGFLRATLNTLFDFLPVIATVCEFDGAQASRCKFD